MFLNLIQGLKEGSMRVEKPVSMCKTASKAPTDNGQQTIEGRQTQFFKPLADPPGDRGVKRRSFFRAGGYTENSNRKPYKKKDRSPVTLVPGCKRISAKLTEILVKNHNCVEQGTHH
jgi:hypothetical protein